MNIKIFSKTFFLKLYKSFDITAYVFFTLWLFIMAYGLFSPISDESVMSSPATETFIKIAVGATFIFVPYVIIKSLIKGFYKIFIRPMKHFTVSLFFGKKA